MLRNRRLLKCFVLLAANIFTGLVAAEQCTAIFPGGIQSHSPSGNIQMGYMSRVYGSGPTLTAPTVTHTHDYQEQVGLCDGVKCTASGTRASTQSVEFLTGTEVPAVFELSASNNNVSNGYQAGTLALPAADYGTVSVGQESTVRFSTADSIYRTKTITTNYKSVIEFQPGTYWVNGNLDWTAQDTRIRRLNGSNGRVTLYVSGNVNIGQLHFEGFSEGQIRIYAKGNVTAGNDFIFPGEIHAGGRVGFGERAKITGGIYSGNFSTGNGAVVRYTRQNHDHRMGALNPAYNSTFELTPGNYWVDGGFDASVASTFRKIGGSGVVRLFVRGNINVQHDASFEEFSGGDLVMYSTGKITLTSQTDLPAFVYAVGDVEINFSHGARYKGGITGRNVYIGQNSIVEYFDPVDLGPLCESGGGPGPIDPDDPIECGVSLEVGPMIAGKPYTDATVTALDEPPSCEMPPVLNVLFNYINPDPRPGYHNPLPISINGKKIAEGGSEEISGIDWDGKVAKLTIEYEEAGRLYLALLDANEQVLSESKNNFVSRPYGLCLETVNLTHDEALLFEGRDDEETLHPAGDDFPLHISAVAWVEDYKDIDDIREAETICNNPLLQNYRQYFDEGDGELGIKLEPIQVAPELEDGELVVTLGRTIHNHNDAGQMTLPDQYISEVGIFMIKAMPPKYLGEDMSHAISLSSRIGRFVPAYLAIEKSIDLEPSCSKAEYSYQGQPIFFNEDARLYVIGKNRQGETTLNYDRGKFWRFGELSEHRMFSTAGIDALDRKIRDDGTECQATDDRNCRAKRLSDGSSLAELAYDVEGDGQRSYSLNGSVTYLRRAMELDEDDAPFDAAVRLFIDREELSDLDEVRYSLDGESSSADYLSEPIKGTQVHLGRVRAENVIASDIPVPPRANLPLWLEQWDGNFFKPEDDQGCTTFESKPVESEYKGSLKEVIVDWQFSAEKQQEGVGIQARTGTDNRFDGSALIEHIIKGPVGIAPFWLCQSHELGLGGICSYDKSKDSTRAMAQVTFGIYKGPTPLIFRRELYRGM